MLVLRYCLEVLCLEEVATLLRLLNAAMVTVVCSDS